jgi:hypothetical protein
MCTSYQLRQSNCVSTALASAWQTWMADKWILGYKCAWRRYSLPSPKPLTYPRRCCESLLVRMACSRTTFLEKRHGFHLLYHLFAELVARCRSWFF